MIIFRTNFKQILANSGTISGDISGGIVDLRGRRFLERSRAVEIRAKLNKDERDKAQSLHYFLFCINQ